MKLVVHRGAHEVGGSCIELQYANTTILVDFGLPLEFDLDEPIQSALPSSLTGLTTRSSSIDGLLLSHPHLDHYGLAGLLPDAISVYCGKATWDLMAATSRISQNKLPLPSVNHFKAWEKFTIGELTITPYLLDHSAFDSYGFLIEGGEKSIFYTGDFRGHGRKGVLIKRLPSQLPEIDALIMEGTLIGNRSEECHLSEFELEDEFARVMDETKGITMVTTSSQNIDRLVTVFKAAKRTGRMFIVDFYTAEILDILKEYARLPNASWPGIRVCYPQFLGRMFEERGMADILEKHRSNGIKWTRINEKKDKMVLLVRPGFLGNLKRFINLDGATWIYSMWPGYFERSQSLEKFRSFMLENAVRYEYLHTSGHAKITDLQKFVSSLKPKMVIPVHSFHTEQFSDYFPNVRLLKDGEFLAV
ncbi:MBL fold metallo-hydrolase [Thermodesulfobacteriota bacterium]